MHATGICPFPRVRAIWAQAGEKETRRDGARCGAFRRDGELFAGRIVFSRPTGAQSAIIDGVAHDADDADDTRAAHDARAVGDARRSDAASGVFAAKETAEANEVAHGAADGIREGRA
ncbi:hypothetical protein B5F40_01240 [Gordonibacter sp. An230]|nr:hypothetical protein B5F40_01240 [Gordonibacter sp. An230]